MIAGIGVDMVAVARIERSLARHGERLARRLLSPRESSEMHGPAPQYVAARVAAKEAVFKALGTGWAAGVTWRDVELVNQPSGAPELRLRGAARERLRALGGRRLHVSVTHTRGHALALVVIEG